MDSSIRIDRVRIEWKSDVDADADGQYSCRAIATVSYAISSSGDRRLEHLSSGSLHGIDTPSPEYRAEVELGELNDLRGHLIVFGIDVRQFATLAGRPELEP